MAIKFADRIVELRKVPASELMQNPANFRKHPTQQRQALTAMLAEVGFAGAVLAYTGADGRLVLIDGHLRADMAGKQTIPVLVTNLSAAEAEALLLSHDALSAMASIDKAALRTLAERLTEQGRALAMLSPLQDLYQYMEQQGAGRPAPADPPPERALELQAAWGTEVGQLWGAGPHRILCCDGRNAEMVGEMMGERRASLVWTDPPFGIGYTDKTEFLSGDHKWNDGTHKPKSNTVQSGIVGDTLSDEDLFSMVRDALKAAHQWGKRGCSLYLKSPGNRPLRLMMDAIDQSGFRWHHTLVWLKDVAVLSKGDYNSQCEFILFGWSDQGHYFKADATQTTVLNAKKPKRSDLHPMQTPIELIGQCIENSSRIGETVLDPFCGSGSVVVAAAMADRVGMGVEIDPKYAAVTLYRLTEMGLKPELLQTFGSA